LNIPSFYFVKNGKLQDLPQNLGFSAWASHFPNPFWDPRKVTWQSSFCHPAWPQRSPNSRSVRGNWDLPWSDMRSRCDQPRNVLAWWCCVREDSRSLKKHITPTCVYLYYSILNEVTKQGRYNWGAPPCTSKVILPDLGFSFQSERMEAGFFKFGRQCVAEEESDDPQVSW